MYDEVAVRLIGAEYLEDVLWSVTTSADRLVAAAARQRDEVRVARVAMRRLASGRKQGADAVAAAVRRRGIATTVDLVPGGDLVTRLTQQAIPVHHGPTTSQLERILNDLPPNS